MEVSGRRVDGSEEVLNICDICMRKRSISRVATGYCIDCRDYLCENCFHVHRDPTPSCDHKLLEGKQMPKDRLAAVDMCNTHKDEKILYFCKVHSALACQKCAFLLHRMCTDVCDISTLSSGPICDQRFKTLTQKIANLEFKTGQTHQEIQSNLSKLDLNKRKLKSDIQMFCKAAHEHLNKIERDMNVEADKICDEDMKKMNDIQQECDSVSAELKIVATNLETNKEPNRRDQLFIAMEKAAGIVEKLDDKLTALGTDNNVCEFTFEPDDCLKKALENAKRLGKLLVNDVVKMFYLN